MYLSTRFRKTVRPLLVKIRHAPGGACEKARSDTAPQTMRSIGLALSLLLCCAANAEADLTIMPLGDSITWGGYPGLSTSPGGYRTRLYTDLQNAGYSCTFVGTSTENPSPLLTQAGQTHHEGHGGYLIHQIANNLDANDGSGNAFSYNNEGFWFHKHVPPDIVLLLIGRGDITQNYQTATMAERRDALIGQIVADSPGSFLFVSNLPPAPKFYTANQNQLLQAFNTQIRDVIVPKFQSLGAHVIFVDQYSNFVDASGNVVRIAPDNRHPDQDGYDLMGDTWAAALRQALPLPVQVTGYSADVISDKDASARFAQPFHGGTFAWFESGAVDDEGAQHIDGLPAGLSLVSVTASKATYQLQPAHANNVLQLSASQTGTLTLTTPTAYSTLYVIASSGDGTGSSVGSGTINFSDGSTQAFSYNSFDWCNGQGGLHPEAVLSGPIGRADVGPNGSAFAYNQDCNFQLYETVIAIDPAHSGVAISSLDFTGAPDAYLSSIFGVSGR
jgi:lysophospholipase L1-like esterase